MIIHLADFAAEYTGNFIYSLVQLSKNLQETLNKQTAIVLPEDAREKIWIKLLKENNIEVLFVESGLSNKEKFKRIKDEFERKNIKPEVIHTHFAGFEMVSISLKKYYNAKLIHHKHMGIERNSIKYKIYDIYKFRYLFNKYVDKHICVSDFVGEIMKKSGIKENNIEVILNGIFTEKHKIDLDKRENVRKKLGFKDDDIIILMFGYDVYVKGTDILIDILDKIDSKYKFILVGKDEMINYVNTQQKYLDNKEKIKIIRHTEDVFSLFNSMDIFLSSSRMEGFSYSIAEAMLYNKKIISSDIKGVKHFKNKVYNIEWFKSENKEDLINKINNLKFDTEILNREFVEKELNINKWCKNIIDVYRRLDEKL